MLDGLRVFFSSWWLSSLLVAIIILGLIKKNFINLQHWFFATIFPHVIREFNIAVDELKAEHLKKLQDLKSQDPHLSSKGLIRILEIGVGPGSNFKYYPKNTSLILLDPNPRFHKLRQQNILKDFKGKIIEKQIIGDAEDLSQEVPDNSVDAVVSTETLCSVRDVQAVLKEVHRVLVPGGKYFFIDHVLGDKGTKYRYLQALLAIPWELISGCHVDRDLHATITNSGLFSKVQMKNVTLHWNSICQNVIGPHVIGTVQK